MNRIPKGQQNQEVARAPKKQTSLLIVTSYDIMTPYDVIM